MLSGSLADYSLAVDWDATEALRKQLGVDEFLREAAE